MKLRRIGLSKIFAVIFWICTIMPVTFLSVGFIDKIQASKLVSLPFFIGSPTLILTSVKSSQPIHGSNISTIAPIVSPWVPYVVAVIVALIAFIGVVYQSRRNTKIEKEKIAAQVEL